VSHRTAARLHGLEGIPRSARSEPIDLSVPHATNVKVQGIRVHRSRRIDASDRAIVDGIPCTHLARTLIDIAPTLTDRQLALALDSGLALHPAIDIRGLRRLLRQRTGKGRAGAVRLMRLVDERMPSKVDLDSELERRLLIALRAAGLPSPRAHYEVVEDGRWIAEVDFVYPRERVAILTNGESIHRRRPIWERDQDVISELCASGWLVVLVTWAQLRDREQTVIARIRRALEATLGARSGQH
jgi:hypothetical protein